MRDSTTATKTSTVPLNRENRTWDSITLALLLLAAAASPASAQPPVIPLWPEGVPGALVNPAPETTSDQGIITNVSVPTLTAFQAPAASRTGAAVVICPGGGYKVLAFDKEGTAIAEWLNTLGCRRSY